ELRQPNGQAIEMLVQGLGCPIEETGMGAFRAHWHSFRASVLTEEPIADRSVETSPLVPSIAKRVYALLLAGGAARDGLAAELVRSFEDQSLFAGNLVEARLPAAPTSADHAPVLPARAQRCVLIHYHLFKNAGSSIDAILQQNFSDRWISLEFPARRGTNQEE